MARTVNDAYIQTTPTEVILHLVLSDKKMAYRAKPIMTNMMLGVVDDLQKIKGKNLVDKSIVTKEGYNLETVEGDLLIFMLM